MAEPGIAGFLEDVAPVVTLAGDRIFPVMIPQHLFEGVRSMPCAVFTLINENEGVTFCGADGCIGADYQIDSFSPKYDVAKQLDRAIRAALVDYCGPMGEGCTVLAVFRTTTLDLGPDPDPGLFRRSSTLRIWYRES